MPKTLKDYIDYDDLLASSDPQERYNRRFSRRRALKVKRELRRLAHS